MTEQIETGGQSNPHKWFASWKILSVVELGACMHKVKDITSSIAWKRGMERGSTRRSSLKG